VFENDWLPCSTSVRCTCFHGQFNDKKAGPLEVPINTESDVRRVLSNHVLYGEVQPEHFYARVCR
jgi:hypothetical protein